MELSTQDAWQQYLKKRIFQDLPWSSEGLTRNTFLQRHIYFCKGHVDQYSATGGPCLDFVWRWSRFLGRKGKVTGVNQVHITLWDMRMCDWLKMDNALGNKSWDGMLCANSAIECLIKMLMLFCLNVLFTLWPTFFKFGHLLSEKGSLLTRQAVHTRTFTWKAARKIQLYFTKVLLHSFKSEKSFQQHETSVSELNLCGLCWE